MAFGRPPLYKATIPTTTTVYIGVPIVCGVIGLFLAWSDAVGAATITLELTSMSADDAPLATAGTYQWRGSGETITGPAASAAGNAMVNLENVRQLRARLKVVTTAVTPLEVHNGVSTP